MKKLLIERISNIEVSKSNLIESIDKNDGRLIIPNVLLQRADTPNKNKRVYPKSVMDRALNEYFQKIKEKRAFSELDHPLNENEANVISLKNVCQVIKDARWKGNEIYGDVEILKTPSGNIVREILLAGYRVGQSSRGLGSVKSMNESADDLVEVQDDFEFLTLADCVSDPSTHNADMIIKEHLNYNNLQESNVDILIRDILCEMTGICCIK